MDRHQAVRPLVCDPGVGGVERMPDVGIEARERLSVDSPAQPEHRLDANARQIRFSRAWRMVNTVTSWPRLANSLTYSNA